MGEEIREELYNVGKKLFLIIGDDLNEIDTHGRYHSFRREEDFEEICIALALLGSIIGVDTTGME